MRKTEAPAPVAPGASAGEGRRDDTPNHSNYRANNPVGPRWTFHRLDTFEARIAASLEFPWFADWFRALMTGKIGCIHCGQDCRDTGLVGAIQADDDQLVTICACRSCFDRSATLQAAVRAAVEAAETGALTDGRSFGHAVAAPEAVQ